METDLKELMAELQTIRKDGADLLYDKEKAIREGIAVVVGPRLGRSPPAGHHPSRWPAGNIPAYDIDLGDWNCSSSPTGFCAYDSREDAMHDCCLFCDEPEERK